MDTTEHGAYRCRYPQSHATARDIMTEIAGVAANRGGCSSMYLDTVEDMSHEGDDHHQGLARTHRLSDGSIWYFLSHSEMDEGEQGILAQFRYGGPTAGEHIVKTSPLTVAPMTQLLRIDERHPADIAFLPDVDNLDAGYLIVTEEHDSYRLSVYRWSPNEDLALVGWCPLGFGGYGPNFVFLDRVADTYYLGAASNHWETGILFTARDSELFPRCSPGSMDVGAFRSHFRTCTFDFPVIGGPSQTKLVRDVTGAWFLLAFRSDPYDDPGGRDFIDVYPVDFDPFVIGRRTSSTHIFLPHGDTGFASNGTHHVEASGRLLVSSSYRWSKDEGPGDASYVTRVDECPSS